jgi:hypothetical protein
MNRDSHLNASDFFRGVIPPPDEVNRLIGIRQDEIKLLRRLFRVSFDAAVARGDIKLIDEESAHAN